MVLETSILSGGAENAHVTRKRKPVPIRVDRARWDIFESEGRKAYFGGIHFRDCPYAAEDEVKWDGWLFGWWAEYFKKQPLQKKDN